MPLPVGATLQAPIESIPAMSPRAIDRVREVEAKAAQLPQVQIDVHHLLHGGMYARTVTIPAGVMITGALIKIPTILSLSGHVLVFVGDEVNDLCGEHVLACSANRKQAFHALADTRLTMIFPTQARTVEEAESEFTDEVGLLTSQDGVTKNHAVATGE